MQKEPLF